MDQAITIGASYYPDHWPRERWQTDIQLMIEAGIKTLRVAELSWSKLESREGQFDFGWLNDFIEIASKEGIEFILGTPIEASPVWLRDKYPEVVRHNKFGRIHGDRGMHCHNNSTFRFYVNRIVTKMVEHFGDHPAVIGWQIDNELRNVDCYCNECAHKFREWLKDRYGTLDKLNETWGTHFWSQIYHDWEEVMLPSADQLTISVSQKLDFTRFGSDSTVNHLNEQVDIIKKHAPHQFVTHNMLGWYHKLNSYDISKRLDFISWDSYPSVDGDNNIECFLHDHFRATKQKSHWVMEQKNGYFNYSDYNLAIEPGLVRLWTYQDIARGANGVMYYRWRSNRWSGEQNPNGLLRHDGTPRRAYYEAQQVTTEIAAFREDLANTKVEAPVAIIYSFNQMWGFDSHVQYKKFDYRGHLLTYYKALNRMGITSDLVDPTTDLSSYKLVIAPSMAMVNDQIYNNFKKYVESGGHLIIGARSGMKTWANTTTDSPWPGLFAELAGIEIDEFEVLPNRYMNTITYNGRDYDVKIWLDMLEPKTAESLAIYNKKFYAGRTAISRNTYGRGIVYYVGVMGNDELASDLLYDMVRACNLNPIRLPKGVYLSSRVNENKRYTFYINRSNQTAHVHIQERGYDILNRKSVYGKVQLNGLDVLILQTDL